MATAVIKTHYSICHKQFHMQLHSHDAYAATPLPLFARTGRHVSPSVYIVLLFILFSSPGKFRPSCAFWINCTRGERTYLLLLKEFDTTVVRGLARGRTCELAVNLPCIAPGVPALASQNVSAER